jgi:hypothetical protein
VITGENIGSRRSHRTGSFAKLASHAGCGVLKVRIDDFNFHSVEGL